MSIPTTISRTRISPLNWKRTTGATVLADQTHALSTAWNLGDCNNKFVLMFVTKEGELVFLRKGVLSDADKEAFYEVLENYK